MQKNLIAAAALLAATGAANADVTLYGLVDMSVGRSLFSEVVGDTKVDFHSGGDDFSSQGNSTTRFGLKGSTDVGSGVKANFKFESAGIKSNGAVGEPGQGFFRRSAWFGLSGGFGEFRVGRQNAVAFETMGDFDLNGESNGVTATGYTGIGSWLRNRESKALQYITPNMGPVSGHFGLILKGNGNAAARTVFSGTVKYKQGPLLLAVSAQSKETDNTKAWGTVAASYDFGVAKVVANYTSGSNTAGDGGRVKGFGGGISAPIGSVTVGAMFGTNTSNNASADPFGGPNSKAIELFANKEVYKNTYAYIEGTHWRIDTIGQQRKHNGFATGLIYVF